MEAIFRVDGNDVVTSPFAAGPWDPTMQHGSQPAAMVVWAAGTFPMDDLVATYPADDINRAVADVTSGAVVKPVLVW